MQALFRPALLGAAAALLSACGGGGGAPAPAPVPPPAAAALAFDGESADGSRRFYRATPGSGAAPQLLGMGYDGARMAMRADGRAIVFHSVGGAQQPTLLMIADDLTRPASVLSQQADVFEREVVFSPDGTQVAFVSLRDDPGHGDVFIARLDGRRLADVRNLTPRRAESRPIEIDVTPVFSPDGTRLAYSSSRNGNVTLWVMNRDGSNARQVTEDGLHSDYYPSWSPDGQWLAFQRNDNVTPAIRIGVVPVAGGAVRLFDLPGPAFAPAFSPDGTRIAVAIRRATERGDDLDIHVLDRDGRVLSRIERAGDDRNPTWLAG